MKEAKAKVPVVKTVGIIKGPFEFENAHVKVILETVHHVSEDPVCNVFDLRATISDGLNPKGLFSRNNISIPAGHGRYIGATIFSGFYIGQCRSGSRVFNFKFDAETDVLANGIFNDFDSLDFNGANAVFNIPVTLESYSGNTSTLYFRGRIEIGCN